MAHRFEKGTHLFFPMKHGFTVQDSQLKPRYYLTLEALRKNLQEGRDYSEVVEYAPVVHAKWDENGRCTHCGGHAPYYGMASTYFCSPYCYSCGAKMDKEREKDG